MVVEKKMLLSKYVSKYVCNWDFISSTLIDLICLGQLL